ncbi:MAG: hypothetical protein JW731_12605 [Bacteroidales bacterium]|nr:hypothetical protein [Bacteroidales bacterium]
MSVADILENAEEIYGPDEFLYRGQIYIPLNPKAQGNPYITDKDWVLSDITLVGEVYQNLEAKYDVHLDLLIIKKEIKGTEVHQPIQLNKELVDGFTFQQHRFTKLSQVDSSGILGGYVEVIYRDKIIFIQKFSKNFLNQYSQSNPYGSYSKLLTEYFIMEDGNITKISNKKSLVRYFEPIKKSLKKEMRKMNFRFKNASSSDFYEILSWCERNS